MLLKLLIESNIGCLTDTLYKSGFGDPLLSWFKSYLADRVQWVKVSDCKSVTSKFSSGVSQGGHLSPILFSLYVNGIKAVVKNCELLMFADDLKLFPKIENLSDCIAFLSSTAFILKISHPPHDYSIVMQELCLISLADRRVNAYLLRIFE